MEWAEVATGTCGKRSVYGDVAAACAVCRLPRAA